MFRNALGAVCGATRFQIFVVTCAIVGVVATFAANVIGGPDAFVITPYTTRDYPAALRRKLADEISLPINEPVSATPVKSAARSIWPVPEEGSAVSGVRRPGDLLSRTKETDLLIGSVHLINRWGVIIASTETGVVGRVPLGILLALSRGKEGNGLPKRPWISLAVAPSSTKREELLAAFSPSIPKLNWLDEAET
jgi:Protein of unknown function (DUF1194)